MKFPVGKYRFDGPISSPDQMEDKPGLFVVYCLKHRGYYIIDVDESDKVKSSAQNHERLECWKENSKEGIITFAVYYTPNVDKEGRKKMEEEIRHGDVFVPCGPK